MKVFHGASVAIDIAANRGENIEKGIKKDMGALQKAVESKKQQANDSALLDFKKNKRAHQNLTTGEYLDMIGY